MTAATCFFGVLNSRYFEKIRLPHEDTVLTFFGISAVMLVMLTHEFEVMNYPAALFVMHGLFHVIMFIILWNLLKRWQHLHLRYERQRNIAKLALAIAIGVEISAVVTTALWAYFYALQ